MKNNKNSKKENKFKNCLTNSKNESIIKTKGSKNERGDRMSSIKAFRESTGKRQEDFARIIGVSAVNYSKKENGSVKFSLEEAKKISTYFNKPIEDIFFAENVSKNEPLK